MNVKSLNRATIKNRLGKKGSPGDRRKISNPNHKFIKFQGKPCNESKPKSKTITGWAGPKKLPSSSRKPDNIIDKYKCLLCFPDTDKDWNYITKKSIPGHYVTDMHQAHELPKTK